MARIGGTGPPRWLFDYVQDVAPDSPNPAESWYDTGSQEVKVYTGTAWKKTGVVSHDALTNVTEADHHNPVTVSGPLTEDGTQGLGMSISGPLNGGSSLGLSIGDGLANSGGTLVADLGNGLGVDSNGRVYIPADAIGTSEIAADAVTSTELASDSTQRSTTNLYGFAWVTDNILDGGNTTNPSYFLDNDTSDETVFASAGEYIDVSPGWTGGRIGAVEMDLNSYNSSTNKLRLEKYDGTVISTVSFSGNVTKTVEIPADSAPSAIRFVAETVDVEFYGRALKLHPHLGAHGHAYP